MANIIKSYRGLILILLLAAIFRFYGLNWDQGAHLHPDERMITMVSLGIHWPNSPQEQKNILTPSSPLNPHFFAYGSSPIYLLKITGAITSALTHNFYWSGYDGLSLAGRVLSGLFDLGTLLILFLIGRKLWSKEAGLLASLFYAIAVLPIQLSHFYAVDTPLTFFITLTLYRIIIFHRTPSLRNGCLVGVFLGCSLATKISAAVLFAPIVVVLSFHHQLTLPDIRQIKFNWHKIFKIGLWLISRSAAILIPAAIVLLTLEPFALIDLSNFWSQTQEQQRMTKDAFTFPYTLQYVGKTPYLHELKNLFLWGAGPFLGILVVAGILFLTGMSLKRFKTDRGRESFLLLVFFWSYFLVVGSFAIGFMRYLLPIYPLLCLAAAVLTLALVKKLHTIFAPSLSFFYILNSIFAILLLLWPLSFIAIYHYPNTRNLATAWIYKNIPPGTPIAVEHWDDGLPIGGQPLYQVFTLPLYEPDTPQKWALIDQELTQTQYIIIASNRLYVPLQKLTDCSHLPPYRCYTKTSSYYQKLFAGDLGFTEVAEFAIYPTIPFTNFEINDFSADESFTVYDHPKIMIFKKTVQQTYAF